jgi:hypothetical protein
MKFALELFGVAKAPGIEAKTTSRRLTHLLILGQALLGLRQLVALSLIGHGIIIVGGHVEEIGGGIGGLLMQVRAGCRASCEVMQEEEKETFPQVGQKKPGWNSGGYGDDGGARRLT